MDSTLDIVSLVLFSFLSILLLNFFYSISITMDPIIELTNSLAHLEQQLRMRKLADEHQRRVTTQVRSQVWKPCASMDYAEYGGTPYLSNHNFGWSHHKNTSWNTSYTILHTPQVQRSILEEAMDELRRTQAKSHGTT